jgi:diphthamide synthase (EF-2-diphthine--ammonia ligase)
VKTLLSRSSGKDSAWALRRLQSDDRQEVVGLLTTVNRDADRVAMHLFRPRHPASQFRRMNSA